MAIPKAVIQAGEDSDAAIDAAIPQSPDDVQDVELDELDQTPEEETPEALELESVEDTDLFEFTSDEASEVPEHLNEVTPSVEGEYEQRYLSLKGKYDNEVPQLHASISRLEGMVEALNTEPTTTSTPKATADSHLRYLSESEASDYGSEVLDLQSRLAKGVSEDIVGRSVSDIESRLAVLEGDRLQSAANLFWERVERQYPGAKTINDSDVTWDSFLNKTDKLSGMTYRQLGENAVGVGDVERIVGLLNKYKPVKAQKVPGKRGSAKPPQSGSRVALPQESSVKYIKESTIRKFYDDVARRKYQGREDEVKKREQQIDDAAAEGRIVPG